MSIFAKARSAYEKKGLRHVLEYGPRYLRNRILYSPFGELERAEMVSCCEERGSIWYYGSEEEFEIHPPGDSDPPEEFLPHLGSHKVPRSFVCEISDVRLLGKYAISQLKGGKFIVEEMDSMGTIRQRLRESFETSQSRFREIYFPGKHDYNETDFDAVLNLVPRHTGGTEHQRQGNYGHWLAEDLPRLRGYKHYSEETGRRPRILLQNNPPGWMLETLRLMGISSSDWVEWERTSATVSNLIVPKLNHFHSIGTAYDPVGRRWVSEVMKSQINLSDADKHPTRIFASRQGQGIRKIANYDEVERVFTEFNIKSIRPEDYSLEEQIKVFHNAEVIIGPFGANLTNIIFSTDATVLEIFPHDEIRPVFYVTANEHGHDYDFIVGEEPSSTPAHRQNADIIVDVEELSTALNGLIGD